MFISVCAIAVAVVVTQNVAAAERTACPEPQLVSDVQLAPVERTTDSEFQLVSDSKDSPGVAADAGIASPQPTAATCGGCRPGCEGSSQGCCDDCCCPLWTVQADALFLNRSRLPGQTLLVNGNFKPQFNADQFDLPVQVGWQIDITRRLNDNWDLEARYFDVGGQSASSPTIRSTVGAGVLFAPTAQGLFFPPLDSNLTYTSRLQDVELNARRSLNACLTVLAGVRYLNLDDRILVSQLTTTGGFDAAQRLDGFNDLLGFQIGGDAVLVQRGRFSLDTALKAGIYNDNARNSFAYDSTALAEHKTSGDSASNVAFCGEIGITATYDLTERLSLRGGYELLWLDGVALASQQPILNPPPLLRTATSVGTSGDVFYNGAFIGLEYRR